MNLKDYLLSNHNIKNYLTIILTIVFTKSRLCESQIFVMDGGLVHGVKRESCPNRYEGKEQKLNGRASQMIMMIISSGRFLS